MTFEDHLWPDVARLDAGIFGEWEQRLTDRLTLRAGGRLDRVRSDARAADDPGLAGRTIRESYADYYGADAARVARTELVGATNVVLHHVVSLDWALHAGAGTSMRPAGVTERYFAFAPAPGGYLVGNPALDPERKVEVVAGLDMQRGPLRGSLSAYHAWFGDYILPTVIDRRDVDGDGLTDVIRGYENVRARFHGVEVAGRLRLGPHVVVPASIDYVRGENRSRDGDLPEIPPLGGRVAVRLEAPGDAGERAGTWFASRWIELGARLAAAQEHIDPSFPEDTTPGFAVLHLRGAAAIVGGLAMEIGVENLLDRRYHEHLTREALLPVGDLAAGDEIPAPGRAVYVDVRLEY